MTLATPIRPALLAIPIVAVWGVVGLGHSIRLPWGRDRVPPRPPVARVERVEPHTRFSMTVPGRINSGRNTLIECQVENISGAGLNTGGGGGRNQRSRTPAGLTIISLVPEGTYVKAGQVLAEIDPSRFEEITRLLQIRVEEAYAAEAKARYDLEAAQIALAEYLDGIEPQSVMQLEGQVSLAKSELQRQKDHLDWTYRVLPLGYLAVSTVRDEVLTMLSAGLTLERAERSLHNYRHYTQPKQVRQLESRLEQAKANYAFALRRRELDEDRLALANLQLERCTIRAPHDGNLVYCTARDGSPIRLGLEVYRRMALFLLPDLERPVVDAQVNQTRIDLVAEGQEARVRIDAKPGVVLRGRVARVSPFPDSRDRLATITGVMRYDVRVELESQEPLLPGLSAEVEILFPAVPGAMTVPSQALSVDGDETVCHVLGPSGVERRVVDARPASIDRIQVVEGLAEGEEVILGPYDPALDPGWTGSGQADAEEPTPISQPS